ncbi:MAG: glutaredoxin family protein [Theionarchaea archaeon]|nr:glutaredoxin family protein [Theionarchaea archaeon]
MTKMNHVEGKDKGHVVLYALSTCVWCRKTKNLLNDLHVEYYYVDADLLHGEEKEAMMEEMKQWNPKCSFPTLVINNKTCVVGYKEDEIKEILK